MNNQNFFQKLAQKIARTLLNIMAISFKVEPYTWASGMVMQNYNDNRLLLGSYKHRWRIATGLMLLLKDQVVHYILGISTAGIAPAASLAQLMRKKLIINIDGKFIGYSPDLWESKQDKKYEAVQWLKSIKERKEKSDFNAIMVYRPELIPYGVQLANILQLPFAYIRKAPKDHGKEKQIEGLLPKNCIPLVIYDGTKINAKTLSEIILAALNLQVAKNNLYEIKEDTYALPTRILTEEELLRVRVIAIEDLISTGGSSALEVHNVREAGAVCDICLSIYNYGFETAKKQFSGEEFITGQKIKLSSPCEVKSLLTFDQMYNEMERLNHFLPETRANMKKEIAGFDTRYEKMLLSKAQN